MFREERISAVCFTVNVTKDVAYYFLPGTGPLFRSHSPMVLLMTGLMDYYKAKGSVETPKPTFELTL